MSGTGEYSPDQFSKEAMVAYARYQTWIDRGPSTADNFFHSKKESKHYDPCQEAANRSIKCIHRNPGNKDFCNEYFQCVPPSPRTACAYATE